MRILHVNKFYYPKRGADRYFFELTKLLEEKGSEVVPFSMEHPKNLKSKFDSYFVSQVNFENPTTIIEKFRVLGRMLYSFEARRRISALLTEAPCDLMHIENIYHQISPSILGIVKKKFKIPIVMTVHDYKLMCPNYRMFTKDAVCERCMKHKFYNAARFKCMKDSYAASLPVVLEMYFHKVFKFYEKYVDVFIAPSEFMKKKMVQWGFKESKIVVIRNFIDTKFFQPQARNGGYFLYSGALELEKGIITILRALKREPSLKVVFAGEGSLKNYAEKFIEENSLQNQAELVGQVDRDTTRELLQGATALLAPSEWYENSPLTVMEAMACAKPVIGSDIGGIPELVDDGKRGYLIKPGDHIALAKHMVDLSQNQSVASSMGRNALRFSDGFTKDRYYRELSAVYDRVLGKAK